MIKTINIENLAHWLEKYGDPKIELHIELDNKHADVDKIIQSDDFKRQINDACKWVQYYFMFHLEKSKSFLADGWRMNIHRAYPAYDHSGIQGKLL